MFLIIKSLRTFLRKYYGCLVSFYVNVVMSTRSLKGKRVMFLKIFIVHTQSGNIKISNEKKTTFSYRLKLFQSIYPQLQFSLCFKHNSEIMHVQQNSLNFDIILFLGEFLLHNLKFIYVISMLDFLHYLSFIMYLHIFGTFHLLLYISKKNLISQKIINHKMQFYVTASIEFHGYII